ncbi:bifunctional nuclease family protein [Hyalangium rubrum]|uniref:Bifunctional nuclease family protein n=1 Tax=Hyalangium rubrum TaxID=3103134 RepID=A0ABU5HFQ0_9BACT|nr:bifunctional nuclease family protein [Hyalangium sp. s54d21]MDY7231627.1 bifunctional nuclease family protein [Hyalangium sp. s54d21]
MKTPNLARLFLAPLSAVTLALGGLLFLPSFATWPAVAAPAAQAALEEPCLTEAGGDPAACKELIELVVRDVVPLIEAQTHAVVLTTQDGEVVLPIFVDESAAVAIAFRLAHMDPPQPLAQDLLDDVVSKLGAEVTEVRIDDLRGDIYTGRVFLQQGKKRLELSARPADSIAMALDGEARIRVTRKVLAMAGISRSDIDSLHEGPAVGGSGPSGMEQEAVPTVPPHKAKEISL